eukprot:g434.t1
MVKEVSDSNAQTVEAVAETVEAVVEEAVQSAEAAEVNVQQQQQQQQQQEEEEAEKEESAEAVKESASVVTAAISTAVEAVNSLLETAKEQKFSKDAIVVLEDVSAKVKEAALDWSNRTGVAEQLKGISVREHLKAASATLQAAREQVGERVAATYASAAATLTSAGDAVMDFRKALFVRLVNLDDSFAVSAKAWNAWQDALEYSLKMDERYTISPKVSAAFEEVLRLNEKFSVTDRTSALVNMAGAGGILNYVSDLAKSGYNTSVESLEGVKSVVQANALRQMEADKATADDGADAFAEVDTDLAASA